jgi:hypothetical protein
VLVVSLQPRYYFLCQLIPNIRKRVVCVKDFYLHLLGSMFLQGSEERQYVMLYVVRLIAPPTDQENVFAGQRLSMLDQIVFAYVFKYFGNKLLGSWSSET